jgi:hypothetical protein
VSVYYNDNDPACCAWLAELMKEGLISHGRIDNRSIADVKVAAEFVKAFMEATA